MLFHVRMDLCLPHDLDPFVRGELVAHEQARVVELQRAGTWRHHWRVAGHDSSIGVLDVDSPDELHQVLSSLPSYRYLHLEVAALAQHPSALKISS